MDRANHNKGIEGAPDGFKEQVIPGCLGLLKQCGKL